MFQVAITLELAKIWHLFIWTSLITEMLEIISYINIHKLWIILYIHHVMYIVIKREWKVQ